MFGAVNYGKMNKRVGNLNPKYFFHFIEFHVSKNKQSLKAEGENVENILKRLELIYIEINFN